MRTQSDEFDKFIIGIIDEQEVAADMGFPGTLPLVACKRVIGPFGAQSPFEDDLCHQFRDALHVHLAGFVVPVPILAKLFGMGRGSWQRGSSVSAWFFHGAIFQSSRSLHQHSDRQKGPQEFQNAPDALV